MLLLLASRREAFPLKVGVDSGALEAQSYKRQQLVRSGADVALMKVKTLLPVDRQISGKVPLTKARPCGAGMTPEVGAFRSIDVWRGSSRL